METVFYLSQNPIEIRLNFFYTMIQIHIGVDMGLPVWIYDKIYFERVIQGGTNDGRNIDLQDIKKPSDGR